MSSTCRERTCDSETNVSNATVCGSSMEGSPMDIASGCVKRVRCTANEKCNATKHRNTKYICLLEWNNAVARTRDHSVALSLTLSFVQRSSLACDCVECMRRRCIGRGSGATFHRRLSLAQARRRVCRARADASMEKERISRWHNKNGESAGSARAWTTTEMFRVVNISWRYTRYY